MNEDSSKNHNVQIISNDRFIKNTSTKLEQLCIMHNQILSEYSLKQNIVIGVCAKEWEYHFQDNLYKVYNQHLIQIENVIPINITKVRK